MLETSARLLRLLSLLQTRRDWGGAELAARLGVSPRTLRRDVERLRGLGYPVHACRGTAGGYRLGAGATMPPLLLDDAEAVAVVLGLRVTGDLITGIEEAALQASAKLDQILPARLRHRVTALQAAVERVPGAPPLVDGAVLGLLAATCRDHERLRFDYHRHDGAAGVRSVEPHRLVSWGRHWYLVAWDLDRDDWRTFRVDRISPRTPTGPRFPPRQPPGGDAAGFVARTVGTVRWRYRTRVVVHAPAEVVAQRIVTPVALLEPVSADRCLLDTGTDSLDTLAARLGMLGVDFEVTEPPELVALIRRLADRYRRATPEA